MKTYEIQVNEVTPALSEQGQPRQIEILRCTVETFDLLTFVQALTATKRGRPAKSTKKPAE